jgi:hypothetical protein
MKPDIVSRPLIACRERTPSIVLDAQIAACALWHFNLLAPSIDLIHIRESIQHKRNACRQDPPPKASSNLTGRPPHFIEGID